MSDKWMILAANALTGAVLDELPLVAPTDFERLLNGSGSMQGSLPLDGRQKSAQGAVQLASWLACAEPNQIAIWVMRGTAPQWCGVIVTHDYDSTTGLLRISGREFGYVLERAYYVVAPNGTAMQWTGDITATATSFINSGLASVGINYCNVVCPQTAGVSFVITFNPSEQHKIMDELVALASQEPGFDWAFDPVMVNGNPGVQCTINAPRRGVSYNTSGVMLDYPGPITKWKVTKDGTQQIPELIATGAGQGVTQLQAVVTAPGSDGYLQLQSVENNQAMGSQSQLDAWAQSQVNAYGNTPPLIIRPQVLGDAWFDDVGLSVGDELTLALTDPYFGATQIGSAWYAATGMVPQRILGIKTTLADGQGTPDLVDLTCGPPL